MQLEYKVLFFHAALSKSVIERALSKSVIEEHYRKSVIEEHYRRASPKNIIKRTLSKSIIEKQRFSHFFPFAAAASAARKSKKVVCQKVPHHHHHCSPHLGKVEVAFPVLMEQINNQRIDSQPDERHRKELQVFHSHLRRGAAPRPNAIQNIVRSSCQNETYGIGQKLVDAKNFLAHIGHPKVNQRARHSHHTKLQKFQHQRSQQVHCQQLESLFRSLVNDTRFAHALLLFVVLGLADAWTRFLLARQIFHVACSVHLQAVHLLRVQIHLHAPIVAAATLGAHHIASQLALQRSIPYKVHPYNAETVHIGEAHILAFIFVHILVNQRRHAFLIFVVAVQISNTFLNQMLRLGNVGIVRRIAPVLPLHGYIHVPVGRESIAVIVVARHFHEFPRPFGRHLFLRLR